ncbi:Polycystin-2 [Phytophthora citrophthora]|uniref:Polycystin-2 n=1 Tax=Phytophthora citrophthora TaxID=4793 RepID=A0AAD9G0H9_9STRA|nr:Polycystin-2 [Phytophthora citrophthora]
MEYGDAARRPKGSGMLSQRYREPEDTDGNETIGSGEVHQDNQSLDSWHRRLQSNGNLVASTPTHRRARPSPEVVNSLDELTEISSIAAVVSMQRWWRRRCAGGQRVAQFQKKLDDFNVCLACAAQYLESPFFTSASGSSKTFLGISSSEEFFEWMKGPFISTTYVDSSASSSLTNNRIIGGIRIGQLRVEKLNCSSRVMPFFSWTKVSTDGYTFYCYGSEDGDFSLKTETKSAIQVSNGDSFVFAGCNDTDTDTERSAFFSTMSVSSSQYSLPAPAYSIVLPRADEAQASSIVLALGSNGYIDSQTRAVMVDLSVYNVMLRHVAALRFLVELPASGGAVASLSAGVAPLTDSFLVDADHWFVTTCRVVVILFYMYLFLDEVLWLARSRSRQSQYQAVWQRSSLKHSRCRPKRRPGPLHSRHGSGVRLVGLLCYVCTWLLRLIAQVKRPSDMPLDSDNFVPLRPYVETFRAAQLALGACICLEWIRLLLMLRVTLLVDLLVRAVVCAAPQLLVLLFIVGLVVMGYASACLLVLGSQSDLFQSLPEALRSLVAILLQSGSGASSLLGSSPLALEEVGHDAAGTSTLRTLLLACFLLLNVFVAANLFLVVVYQGYLEAKREIEADRRRLKPPGHNSSGDDYLEPAPLHLDLYHEVVVYLRTLSTKLHGFLLPIFRRRKTAEMQSSVFPADTSGPKLSEIESDDEQDDKLPKEPSSKRQKRQEGPNDNTKLLEGMILQLALQNEALLRAVNELKQDVQALQHSENTSSSDRDLLRRGSVALTVPARVHKQRKGIVNSGSNLVTIPDAQNNQLL